MGKVCPWRQLRRLILRTKSVRVNRPLSSADTMSAQLTSVDRRLTAPPEELAAQQRRRHRYPAPASSGGKRAPRRGRAPHGRRRTPAGAHRRPEPLPRRAPEAAAGDAAHERRALPVGVRRTVSGLAPMSSGG
jgi:hypothetical protein